jgi:hypothetical protein
VPVAMAVAALAVQALTGNQVELGWLVGSVWRSCLLGSGRRSCAIGCMTWTAVTPSDPFEREHPSAHGESASDPRRDVLLVGWQPVGGDTNCLTRAGIDSCALQW